MQGGPFSLERLLLLLLGGAGVAAGGWLALEMGDGDSPSSDGATPSSSSTQTTKQQKTNHAMEAERALRSIRGGDVRKEEEEERRESEGSGRHRRGGAKLALLPPIFELKIILEEP